MIYRFRFAWLVLLVACVLALLVVTRPEQKAELRQLSPITVSVTRVVLADVHPHYRLTGQLQPVRSSSLRFEVAGRIAERLVEPGQTVAAGETLLRLDEGDYADALALADAQLQQEDTAVERDRRLLSLAGQNRALQVSEVGRLEKLGSESLTSRSQLGEARQRLLSLQSDEARLRYSVESAEARLAQKQAERSRARRNLQRTRLLAPYAGTVNRVEAQVGDYVSPGGFAVELIDTTALDLYAEVGYEPAAALKTGQPITVTVQGLPREGRLVAIQQSPNAETHTYALRIRLPGDGVLPGTLAVAALPLTAQQQVMLVPVAALLREEGRVYLFVYENDQVRRVAVEVGIRDGEYQVVQHGIAPGMTIVARDVVALSDGQVVQITPDETAPTS